MPLKIIRNDITKMRTDAIVNPANSEPTVGRGCDLAVYKAAGRDELLRYRIERIGSVPEGEAFETPSFNLGLKCIIHAVSPCYIDGEHGEEEKLRDCYRNSLTIAKRKKLASIAFPLLASGAFGYPREAAMRIAADEINAFLLGHDMTVYLVVFDTGSAMLGEKLDPDLEVYIDHNYVVNKRAEEYGDAYFGSAAKNSPEYSAYRKDRRRPDERLAAPRIQEHVSEEAYACAEASFNKQSEDELSERISHISDSFRNYLFYLIEQKGLSNAEVWKQSLVDKKLFSKIKNNPDYHPKKITALCLCVGAHLSIDETNDLLLRAGYALSPCDITDVIFSYFITHEVYDMIEIDIQLEEHGVPCIIQ